MISYLLLVSFLSGNLNNFDINKIKIINESPYNGVAVALADAYDVQQYTEKDFEEAVSRTKTRSQKHIWPWVFFNRFVGGQEGEKTISSRAHQPYFLNIKGMDLYNETGALQDFYNLWRLSLRIAKKLGSPGIIVDPEVYNSSKLYNLSYLAQLMDKPEDSLKRRLEVIGGELADIAAEEYPQATIWFLFSTLDKFFQKSNYRSISYIILGMLNRSQEKKLDLKFVSGGEVSLGYCYDSLQDMLEKISKRNDNYREMLQKYPNLYLGGTIAPSHDFSNRKKIYYYWASGKCASTKLNNLEDFKPLIKQLLTSYKFVWIYAAPSLGYDPYLSELASKYNKALSEIREP